MKKVAYTKTRQQTNVNKMTTNSCQTLLCEIKLIDGIQNYSEWRFYGQILYVLL